MTIPHRQLNVNTADNVAFDSDQSFYTNPNLITNTHQDKAIHCVKLIGRRSQAAPSRAGRATAQTPPYPFPLSFGINGIIRHNYRRRIDTFNE